MKAFKLNPEGYIEKKQKILITTIPFTIFAGIIAIFLASLDQNGNITIVDQWQFIVPIYLLGAGFSISMSIKTYRDKWANVEFIIDNEKIQQNFKNAPLITVYWNEVREIVETARGQLIIKTGEPFDLFKMRRFIYIDKSVQDREELIKLLGNIRKIDNKEDINEWMLINLAPPAVFGALIAFICSKNLFVIVSTGVFLVFLFLWFFAVIQRSKAADKKTKRSTYPILLFLILIILRILLALIFPVSG